jgi:hypothetical protein
LISTVVVCLRRRRQGHSQGISGISSASVGRTAAKKLHSGYDNGSRYDNEMDFAGS